jgi:four helix bundle protein
MDIVKYTYQVTATLPKEERFGIVSQMNRAAVSIPSNIAEGCSRNSEMEFKRFLEVAQGSAFELETQLILLEEIGLMNVKTNESKTLLSMLHEEQRMISALINKIKSQH